MKHHENTDAILRAIPEYPSGECAEDSRLLDYRGQRLEPKFAIQMETHLADCARCRARLARLAAPVPEALELWARRHTPKSFRLPAAAAAVALIAIVLLLALVWPSKGAPKHEAELSDKSTAAYVPKAETREPAADAQEERR